jgi:hypothetical protein
VAVAIKFNNVVVRKSAVADKLAGALPPALRAWAVQPVTDSGLLVWPALMDWETPEGIAGALRQAGLRHGFDGGSDFAVVAPGFPESYPEWLEVGHVGTRRACWLKGTDPGELVDWRRGAEPSGAADPAPRRLGPRPGPGG